MMTIDGTDISTFGLKLSSVDGYYGQPARKKVLDEVAVEEKDIVHEGKETTVILFGRFASKAAMFTAIQGLQDLIKTNPTHDYILNGHSLSFTGILLDGIKVDPVKTVARVTFKITIIE